MNRKDQELLKIVATALKELVNEVVFVGGITTSLYIKDKSSANTTPTDDVDMIVNITSWIEYEKLEKRLNLLGFKRNIHEPGPMCRFELGEVLVDVMPIDEKILGFSNEWYLEGFQNAETRDLDGIRIKTLSLPYFFATKFAAFQNRGKDGPIRESKDLEDIVVVLSSLKNIESEIGEFKIEIQRLIKTTFRDLIKNEGIFREAIHASLTDLGREVSLVRTRELLSEIKKLVMK